MISASRSSASARSVATAVAVGLGRLEPALALALEHRQVVARGVLLGLLQLVHDQPQRVHALALARLHRVLHVMLHSLEYRHRVKCRRAEGSPHREPAPGAARPDHEWSDLWPLA